jgi:hypothetical protein
VWQEWDAELHVLGVRCRRFCFCKNDEKLTTACEKLEAYLKQQQQQQQQ